MKLTVQLIVETDDGAAATVHEVACLERGMLRPEDLGLKARTCKVNGLERGCWFVGPRPPFDSGDGFELHRGVRAH
jgi:hypothetical protein